MVAVAEVVHLPVGRELFIDEQGRGLRATWHLERGLVNLSIWRGDRCSETFQLSLADAARLVGFLVDGLSEATGSLLNTVLGARDIDAEHPAQHPTRLAKLRGVVRSSRQRFAAWLAPED